jgi:cytochrome P450
MADAGSPATTPQRSQECSPPGPKGLPVIGHLLEIRRDPLGFFSTCSERYGNIVSLRFGTWPALLLSVIPPNARALGGSKMWLARGEAGATRP